MALENSNGPAKLRLKITHDFSAVRGAASEVRKFLEKQGLAEPEVWACELAMVEGCNNAVAYVEESEQNAEINLEVQCSREQVRLKIMDNTKGFDFPESIDLPSPEEERGRGLYLIQALMDEVEYVREGPNNSLLLQKNRTGI